VPDVSLEVEFVEEILQPGDIMLGSFSIWLVVETLIVDDDGSTSRVGFHGIRLKQCQFVD